jgi:hypothetical protein
MHNQVTLGDDKINLIKEAGSEKCNLDYKTIVVWRTNLIGSCYLQEGNELLRNQLYNKGRLYFTT